MKKSYKKIIVLLFISKISFCQFAYKELLNLMTKTNEEVTTFLSVNKKGWSYLKFDKEKDSHIWKKGNEKLILNYYSSKTRIIKYCFHNSRPLQN